MDSVGIGAAVFLMHGMCAMRGMFIPSVRGMSISNLSVRNISVSKRDVRDISVSMRDVRGISILKRGMRSISITILSVGFLGEIEVASSHDAVRVRSGVTSVRGLGIMTRDHDVAHKWHAIGRQVYVWTLPTIGHRHVGMKTLSVVVTYGRVGARILTILTTGATGYYSATWEVGILTYWW
jgi:hypothetical protein